MDVNVTVTIKTDFLELLHKNEITLDDEFIKCLNTGASITIDNDVARGTCKISGSLEHTDIVRTALLKLQEKLAGSGKNSVSKEFPHTTSSNEIGKIVEKTNVLGSNRSLPSSEPHSSKPSVLNVNELNENSSVPKVPKRVRELKSASNDSTPLVSGLSAGSETPKPAASVNTDMASWTGGIPDKKLAEERGKRGNKIHTSTSLTSEEIRDLVKAGQLISIDVDKDLHNYLQLHFFDDLNKEIANVYEYEEHGKHKVALEPILNTRNAGTSIHKKYKCLLARFCCETYKLPANAEISVMESVAQTSGLKHVSVSQSDNKGCCKLLGDRNEINLLKEQIEKQLDFSKVNEEGWQVQPPHSVSGLSAGSETPQPAISFNSNMVSWTGGISEKKLAEEKGKSGDKIHTSTSLTSEEIRDLVKAGQLISIDVDKDLHNYLQLHFFDDLNKEIANVYEYEEHGKHKVALEPILNTRNAGTSIRKKYEALLCRICCETYKLPANAEISVMESVAQTSGLEHVSVSRSDDKGCCKLLGDRNEINLLKEQIKKQLDILKVDEEGWQVQPSKNKKGNKDLKTFSFAMKDGKLIPQSGSLKSGLFEIKVTEWKNDKLAETVVFAVDSKLQHDKDSKAVRLWPDKHYEKEFKKAFSFRREGLSFMEVVQTEPPKDLKKVKVILHMVLVKEFGTRDAFTTEPFARTLTDGIINCLQYSEKELHFKTLAIPYLCPGFCDVDTFVHSAVEALRCFTKISAAQKSTTLRSVMFIAKDAAMKQEMAQSFTNSVDNS